MILALEHFRNIIEGHETTVESDHKNLQWLSSIKHSSGQLARWAMRLESFRIKIGYRPGTAMPVADALSRNPLPEEAAIEELENDAEAYVVVQELPTDDGTEFQLQITAPREAQTHATEAQDLVDQAAEVITREEIRREQQHCPVCQNARQALQETRRRRAKGDAAEHRFQEDGELLPHVGKEGELGIVLPANLRPKALRLAHDDIFGGHLGRAGTQRSLQEKYWWPHMQRDVAFQVKSCLWCLRSKSTIQRRAGLLRQPRRVSDGHLLGMDLVGYLPQSDSAR